MIRTVPESSSKIQNSEFGPKRCFHNYLLCTLYCTFHCRNYPPAPSSFAKTPKTLKFPSKDMSVETQCGSNGTSNIQNYVLLLNEWKMMFIVYFGVLFGAILINISVTYPSNLNSTLFNAMNSVPFLQSPVVQDLIVLAVSLLISIPLISWIVIPLLLKVTRKWVMDQIINVHELKSQSSRKWTCSEIMARGLIPIPNYILMDRDQFQSFPIKWKFAVLIYIAVLISEFVLWSFLYKHGLSKWRYTNIHQEIDIDVRLRFALFLTFDLMASIPLMQYSVSVSPLFNELDVSKMGLP